MEDNPSTSQRMDKRQARQWKTCCCVPQCNNNSERNKIKKKFKKLRENGSGS